MDFGGIRINSLTMVQLPWILTLLGWGVFLLTRPCLSRSDCAAADGTRGNDALRIARYFTVKAVLVRMPPKILLGEHVVFLEEKLRSWNVLRG